MKGKSRETESMPPAIPEKGRTMLISVLYLAIGLPVLGWSEGASLSLKEVLDRNIEARGGAESWKAIRSMKIQGQYTSFSVPKPFTIYRKRPDFYRFEHFLSSFEVLRCFDGEKAWWVNPMYGPRNAKPNPTFKPQDRVTLREKLFDCPLLGFRELGYPMELLGKVDFEGEDHYKIKVSPPGDGDPQTWFIHAETFLETKLETTTYAYGNPSQLDAYFSDYREVGGILLPFMEEQEFHTRARVFELEKVEINPDLDDALFQMPAPEAPAEEAKKEGR